MTKLYFKEAAFLVGAFALIRTPDEIGALVFAFALSFIAACLWLEARDDKALSSLSSKVELLHGQVQDILLKRGGR